MKTTFTYDHYYDYEELTNCLKQLCETYPDLMKMESICESEEGKQVWAVTIAKGDDTKKPAFYMDGNHHAGEVTGSMECMHFIDTIVTNNAEASVAKLLAKNTIYVIPKISPDGSDTYLHTSEKLRSVNRMYPLKNLDDGLHAADIDHNGIQAMMRVKTPYGAWKKKPGSDFLMTKRMPDDTEGEFYNIYPEGVVQNYDGLHITIGTEKWGLDFNRNYPFGWFTEYRQPGAGKYPLSNPENKAVADFVIAHPNIVTALTMHTSGGVLCYPPGTMPSDKADQEDMRMYKEIGLMATEEMKYPVVNIFDNFLADNVNYSSGAFDDWCYHTQGIPTYTVELWNLSERAGNPNQWPVKRDKSDAEKEEEYAKEIAWIQQNCPDKILPWTAVEHPQLGEVEIGGVDFKFTFQNCPNNFLLQEMEKTTAFALRHANVLPELKIEKVETEKLGDGLYQVKAVVANRGYLPTYVCNEAKHVQVDKKLTVSLTGAEIVSSSKPVESLSGFFNVKTGFRYYGIQTDNYDPCVKAMTWVVKAEEGTDVTVCMESEKCGTVSETVKLN